MTSHNMPSFVNLHDAVNQSARINGKLPRLEQGANTTHPSSPRPNPVNGAPNGTQPQSNGLANVINDMLAPGQVSREALLAAIQQLNIPIGTQEDDRLLIRTLYESDDRGQTFRQALDSLSGVRSTSSYRHYHLTTNVRLQVHGHTATQWREYFLDHGRRIFKLLSKYQPEPSAPAVPARPPQAVGPPMEASSSISRVAPPRNRENGHRDGQFHFVTISGMQSTAAAMPRPSSRTASSSNLAGPSRSQDRGRPSSSFLSQRRNRDRGSSYSPECPAKNPKAVLGTELHATFKRPTSSPEPPARREVTRNGGIKFTSEDKEFFEKFTLWEVGKNPKLTKSGLLKLLAAKVCRRIHFLGCWN